MPVSYVHRDDDAEKAGYFRHCHASPCSILWTAKEVATARRAQQLSTDYTSSARRRPERTAILQRGGVNQECARGHRRFRVFVGALPSNGRFRGTRCVTYARVKALRAGTDPQLVFDAATLELSPVNGILSRWVKAGPAVGRRRSAPGSRDSSLACRQEGVGVQTRSERQMRGPPQNDISRGDRVARICILFYNGGCNRNRRGGVKEVLRWKQSLKQFRKRETST